MSRLNKVLLQGRLGGEPEIKEAEGGKIAVLNVAVDASYKDDDGTWQDQVDWIRVVTFRDKLIDKALSAEGLKGQAVFVDGRLKTRSYDKDGETRYATEVLVGAYGNITVIRDKPA